MSETLSAIETIAQKAAPHGLLLTSAQQTQLVRYAGLLLEWNKKINLISRKDEEHVLSKHILHSLSITFFHPFKSGERVLDIGTGGGLPAIPLAILFPDTHFLGVDSIGKKIHAAAEMISALGLRNVLVKKARAEELRGVKFETVVSRAVAPLQELCQWSDLLLVEGGTLIALKGGDLQTEIDTALVSAAEHLAFPEHIDTHPIDFLGEEFAGKVVVIAT